MKYQNKLKRHAYILSLLATKRVAFDDIRRRVLDSLSDIEEYTIRTFQRDIIEIEELFKVPITYSKYYGMYEIEDKMQYQKNIDMLNILVSNVNSRYNKQFVIEEKDNGLGTNYLDEIIYAIENEFVLVINYQKYNSHEIVERRVLPLMLKENNHRWYILGEDAKIGEVRVFGLDRVAALSINFTRQKSRFIKSEVRRLWSQSMGITFPKSNNELFSVKLQFDTIMSPYVISLPWHSSQQVLDETEGHIIVRVDVLIDNTLINKILSCIGHVKVLEPDFLKKLIYDKLQIAISDYE